jgi:integrase
MGIKGIILIDTKTKDITHFVWAGKGDPPPFIQPKIVPKPRRTSRIFGDIGADYTSVFRCTIEAIRKKSGIDWHFHLLRHYFGSTLLARGVDIVTIGSLLGHSRAMTTLIYSHTDEGRKKKAVDILMKFGDNNIEGDHGETKRD